jgi:large conductance mechanosensitive channel
MPLLKKLPGRNMWAEFKAFAFKGNMVDLAIAVVIGAAFSGVINSLVKDIIMPTVSYAITAAKEAKEATVNVANKATSAVGLTSKPATTQSTTEPAAAAPPETPAPPPAPPPAPAKPADEKPVDFDWKIGRIRIGSFLAELLNFIIVAFAVFLVMVKILGSVMKKVVPPAPAGEPTTRECPKCLSMIPYKAVKCAHCTADIGPVAPAT